MSLLNLPEDVIKLIFGYLNTTDFLDNIVKLSHYMEKLGYDYMNNNEDFVLQLKNISDSQFSNVAKKIPNAQQVKIMNTNLENIFTDLRFKLLKNTYKCLLLLF